MIKRGYWLPDLTKLFKPIILYRCNLFLTASCRLCHLSVWKKMHCTWIPYLLLASCSHLKRLLNRHLNTGIRVSTPWLFFCLRQMRVFFIFLNPVQKIVSAVYLNQTCQKLKSLPLDCCCWWTRGPSQKINASLTAEKLWFEQTISELSARKCITPLDKSYIEWTVEHRRHTHEMNVPSDI